MLPNAANTLAGLLLLAIAASCGSDADTATDPVPEPPNPVLVAGGLDQAALKQLGQLTASVQKAPQDSEAWAALAIAYESSRVPAGAHVAYAAAASLNPTDPKLWYRAAIMAARGDELELALERLEKVVQLEPEYGPAWRRRGTWLLDLGRAREARTAFERAAVLLPDRPDAFLGLASVALAEDEVETALQYARTALEQAPGDPYARNILGNALRRSGLKDEAKRHLVAGQGSVPSYVDPWSEDAHRASRAVENSIAQVEGLIAEKKWTEAIVILRELHRTDPTNSKLPIRLGVTLMSARRFEEAIKHYEEATVLFPANYDLQAAKAAAQNATGRVAAALKTADDAIRRWPDRSPAHLQRGAALQSGGDVEGARSAYQRASQLKPSDLRGPLFEGRMLAKARRYQEAADVLESALDLPGASAPLLYFKNLIAARAAAGADRNRLQEIVAKARLIHGAAAEDLLP